MGFEHNIDYGDRSIWWMFVRLRTPVVIEMPKQNCFYIPFLNVAIIKLPVTWFNNRWKYGNHFITMIKLFKTTH